MIIYLIAISVIIGAVLQVNLIGSRAFLVSRLDPIFAVYTGILAGLISTVFFRIFSTPKIKFAYFACIMCFIQTIGYGMLFVIKLPPNTLAITWITFAAFSIGLCKWITVEMANKYLDPARSQSFFSYLSSFLGIGFIISFLLLRLLNLTLSPEQTLATTSILFFLISGLIAIGFFPKHILEINFEKKTDNNITIDFNEEKNLKTWFSLLCLIIGASNIIYSYLINIQLKFHLDSFERINDVINNFTLIASILVVCGGLLLGQTIKRKRTSPIHIIIIAKTILLLITLLCLFLKNFELFIALEIAQKFIGQSLITPSMQQMINSFINQHKKVFISLKQFFYFTLASPLMAVAFYFTSKLSHNNETISICLLIIIINLLGYYALKKFENIFKSLLRAYIKSNLFVAKVLATQMLSFLRPAGFVRLMKNELDKNQKNYLRKTIIIGLGYSEDSTTTEIIKNEFKNEKEEVQIAVLNALSTKERFEGVSFLMDILSRKVLPKSFQVRLNATKLIAELYNIKAIPIILEGLYSTDARVIANVLETLSLFKNKDLIKYFIKFSQHDVPRVRANALMGCYRYNETKAIYRELIRESLNSKDERYLPSFFYIIGILKDRSFNSELEKLAQQGTKLPNSYIAPLSYALICNHNRAGFDLAINCFNEKYEQGKEISFTHFFSQLSKVQRFDFVRRCFNFKDAPEKVKNHLKNSRFDFHEEVDYLNILIDAGL